MSGGWYSPDPADDFHNAHSFPSGRGCASAAPVAPQTSITPQMFLDFFVDDPVMSAYTVDQVQMKIDAAASFFNPCRWGDKYNLGQYYYVAHSFAFGKLMGLNGGVSDTTTSKKAGGVSKGISADLVRAQNDQPFLRTLYGQEYLRIRNSILVGAIAL